MLTPMETASINGVEERIGWEGILSVFLNPLNLDTNVILKSIRGGDARIGININQWWAIEMITANDFQGGGKKAVWNAIDNS